MRQGHNKYIEYCDDTDVYPPQQIQKRNWEH